MGAPLHCYTCAGGGGQILDYWGKAEPEWHCGVMVEAVNHRWLHSTSLLNVCKVFEHLHMLWMGIWVHHYTDNCAGDGGQFLENWGKAEPKWHCGDMVEAKNHCWLHSISILDVNKVFELLYMLWMGIWVNHFTVIPVQVGAKSCKIGVRGRLNDIVVSWLRQ